jgi:hypothetical protein
VHGAPRMFPSQDRLFDACFGYSGGMTGFNLSRPVSLGAWGQRWVELDVRWLGGCSALPTAHLDMLFCIASCRAVSTASARVESLLSQQIAFGVVVRDTVLSIVLAPR